MRRPLLLGLSLLLLAGCAAWQDGWQDARARQPRFEALHNPAYPVEVHSAPGQWRHDDRTPRGRREIERQRDGMACLWSVAWDWEAQETLRQTRHRNRMREYFGLAPLPYVTVTPLEGESIEDALYFACMSAKGWQ